MKIETIFFFHIDELREENNINIDDFIEDICSRRQYWRYKSGENLCPQDKFTKFLIKLNISHGEFFNYFYAKELNEYKKLSELYYEITANKKNEAKTLLASLEGINFVSFETKSLYDLCKLLYENQFSSISPSQKLANYSKKINYPDCINRTFFSYRDLVVLIQIAKLEYKNNIMTASDFLLDILKKDIFYVSVHTRFFMHSIYVSLAKIFGSLGKLSKSMEISQEGLNYCKQIQDSRALPNLYYLSALAKYKLGIRDQYEEDLVKCVFASLSAHSVSTYKTYLGLMKKVFGINEEILLNMINSYIMSNKEKE